MRRCLLVSMGALLLAAGCGEVSIGQPCTFGWPRDTEGNVACDDYPACAPLQDVSSTPPRINNNACPVDCIQMPTLQCENLICVTTQVFGDGNEQHINGQCKAELLSGSECDGRGANFGCQGYCTKECLSDASCPRGYSCSHMAPFGENLRCDDKTQWGTNCTDSCVDAGQSPAGYSITCPDSQADLAAVCDKKGYTFCCACMCYRYCPLLDKKFCRKVDWDKKMFPPEFSTSQANCGD